MSQTFTGAADWSDYIHSNPSSIFDDAISTDLNPNQTNLSFNSPPPSGSNNPIKNRKNQVTKPARKRSRASRRTPTTLLSTNTSNFRAMVQQFTGGPSALGYGIDHPLPRRVTDHQPARGLDGLGPMSSLQYTNPWSGYSFQPHLAPQAAYGAGEMIVTNAAASGGIAKSDGGGGGSSFLY